MTTSVPKKYLLFELIKIDDIGGSIHKAFKNSCGLMNRFIKEKDIKGVLLSNLINSFRRIVEREASTHNKDSIKIWHKLIDFRLVSVLIGAALVTIWAMFLMFPIWLLKQF